MKTASLAIFGALVLGAPAALAAANSTDSSMSADSAKALCSKLSDQFQDLTPFKKGLPYWQEAKADYTKGKTACSSSNPVKGAQAMQAAISDLYVKPDTL
jgi:hypothetical protein